MAESIADAIVDLKVDTSQLNKKLRGVREQTKKTAKSMNNLGGVIKSALVIGAIVKLGKAVISAGAQVEDFRAQFISLGLSAADARAQTEALSEFAAKTPFQLENIVKASQTLFVFSEGVLGGIESLTLFGDVAASVGSPLEDVTFWTGRLNASLASGRPILDSITALQRMKIIAPSVAKAMIEMGETGAEGSEIWDIFTGSLDKFSGGMERQSKTVSGQISTMKDTWTKAFSEMGDSLKDTTKEIIIMITGLSKIIGPLSKIIGAAREGIQFAAANIGALVGGASLSEAADIAAQQVFVDKAVSKIKEERGIVEGGEEAGAAPGKALGGGLALKVSETKLTEEQLKSLTRLAEQRKKVKMGELSLSIQIADKVAEIAREENRKVKDNFKDREKQAKNLIKLEGDLQSLKQTKEEKIEEFKGLQEARDKESKRFSGTFIGAASAVKFSQRIENESGKGTKEFQEKSVKLLEDIGKNTKKSEDREGKDETV